MSEPTFGDVIRLIIAGIVLMIGSGLVARLIVAVAHAAAIVAKLRVEATRVLPLSGGWWVVVEGGLFREVWEPIARSDARLIDAPKTRPFEFHGEQIHVFAVQILSDSVSDLVSGQQTDPTRIRGIRYYPKQADLWRKAIDYLKVNWDVVSRPTEGTWVGPNYHTVADLLSDVRDQRPSPTVIEGETVRNTAQITQ